MKDKLEKTGHKKNYYVFKSAMIVFMVAIALTALAAIPIGITYRLAMTEAKGKEETTSRVESSSSTKSADSSSSSIQTIDWNN
jgi:hypothetical protein